MAWGRHVFPSPVRQFLAPARDVDARERSHRGGGPPPGRLEPALCAGWRRPITSLGTPPVRILLVHSGADLYGSSRSLLRLSGRLVRDGEDVLVVLPWDGPLRAALEAARVPVVIHRRMAVVTRHRFGRVLGLIGLAVSIPISVVHLYTLIRRFRPDLVHTNTAIIVSSGVAARLAGVPHLWHIREYFDDFPALWRWYRRFMRSFAAVVVCVSAAAARQFEGARGKARIVVCHNGFPRAEFEGVTTKRVKRFREKVGLKEAVCTVGVVGRIKCGRKGQDVFVRAAAIVVREYPDVMFALIGSPYPGNETHLDQVQRLVADLGLGDRVVYCGDVEDIEAAYTALDISVLPSADPEPFGGVVIEAMAIGIPVIGTRIGGTPEQIEDGVTGLLVEPNDPEGLARAIIDLLHDPERARGMGSRGRERFLRHFEFEPFYERIRSEYRAVARS